MLCRLRKILGSSKLKRPDFLKIRCPNLAITKILQTRFNSNISGNKETELLPQKYSCTPEWEEEKSCLLRHKPRNYDSPPRSKSVCLKSFTDSQKKCLPLKIA